MYVRLLVAFQRSTGDQLYSKACGHWISKSEIRLGDVTNAENSVNMPRYVVLNEKTVRHTYGCDLYISKTTHSND